MPHAGPDRRRKSGAESEQLIPSDSLTKVPLSWSHDGQFLLYVTGAFPANNANLWVLPLSGDRKPIPYMPTTYSENGARFSPNDRWVAFGSNESGLPQIYVAPFPATGEKDLVSAEAPFDFTRKSPNFVLLRQDPGKMEFSGFNKKRMRNIETFRLELTPGS